MQVVLDVPPDIASIFESLPELGINEIAKRSNLTNYEARVWSFALRNGKVSHVDESYPDRVKKYFNDKGGTVDINSLTISTLDEALAVADVDLSKYEVERHVINSWGVTNKEGQYYTNYQVKVWLKNKTPQQKSFETLLEKIESKSPNVPKLNHPARKSKPRRELEIDLLDPHLGMHCFKGGSDLDQTIESCEQLVLSVLDELLAYSEAYGPFERIIWPFGHDYLHADNLFNTTTAGTPQPEAEAWQHVYERGELLGIAIVNRLKEIAPVKMVVVPGNHDRHSAFTMGRVFNAWFHNDQNVEVLCTADPYKFHRYGVNLIGFEHGHSITPIRLAALMANETRRDGWADAKYCEWHLGDQHRKGSAKPSVFEEQGVSVEFLPGLTAPNEWHRLKSFNHQKRSGMAFVWDHDRGPVARLQTNVDNETGLIMGEKVCTQT